MQNLFSYVFQCKWHTRPYRSNDTVNTCFHCWNVNLVLIAFCPYIQWSSYDFFSSFWSFPSVSIFSSFYNLYYNHCNALQEPFLLFICSYSINFIGRSDICATCGSQYYNPGQKGWDTFGKWYFYIIPLHKYNFCKPLPPKTMLWVRIFNFWSVSISNKATLQWWGGSKKIIKTQRNENY